MSMTDPGSEWESDSGPILLTWTIVSREFCVEIFVAVALAGIFSLGSGKTERDQLSRISNLELSDHRAHGV